MAKLSIIIVSYNTRERLRECLESVEGSLAADAMDHEIFVVDNASADGSADLVRERFPQVRLIANAENRGFAAANNQALAQARGDYILLLNSDTIVAERALAEMVAFLDSYPRVGAVGAKLLNPDGSFQHGAFHFPTLGMIFLDFFPINHRLINSRLNGRYPISRYRQPFPIDHPLGACLIVRREVVDEVGPLDEGFFIYCEEIDWCWRIKEAGWGIYCVPQAKVIHYGGESTAQVWGPMYAELHRSRFRLYRKHYPVHFQWAARALVALGMGRELARSWWQRRGGKLSPEQYRMRAKAFGQVLASALRGD